MNSQSQSQSQLASAGFFFDRTVLRPMPMSDLFFAPCNITALQGQLEQALSRMTGETVKVPVNEEFLAKMNTILSTNASLAWAGPNGLSQLNQMFLQDYTSGLYYMLRQRKLYHKYFINGDRMRVFPYGEPTKVTRGEVTIDPSGYMTNNPHGHQYASFLKDILCIDLPPANCSRAKEPGI